MSGGSYNYQCYHVSNEYEDRMFDEELNEMIKDLVPLLKDLEWWQSDDIGEEKYRKTVQEFKDKWFGKRQETTKAAIIKILLKTIEDIGNL